MGKLHWEQSAIYGMLAKRPPGYMAPRRGLLRQGIDMRSAAPNKAGWNERC